MSSSSAGREIIQASKLETLGFENCTDGQHLPGMLRSFNARAMRTVRHGSKQQSIRHNAAWLFPDLQQGKDETLSGLGDEVRAEETSSQGLPEGVPGVAGC